MVRLRRIGVLILLAIFIGVTAFAGAGERASIRLVFEKPVKMKRAAATLYLPVKDPILGAPDGGTPRRLLCSVRARDRRGAVVGSGEFRLRLLGRDDGGLGGWKSAEAGVSLDGRGDAIFEAAVVAELLATADGAGVEPDLFQVEFDGGRGGRLVELTVRCFVESVEEAP